MRLAPALAALLAAFTCSSVVRAEPLFDPAAASLPHHRTSSDPTAGTPLPLAPSGRIAADLVAESSALLASPGHSGVFWTLNDSGGTPDLFALDAHGLTIGPPVGHRVTSAENVDWEALAALPDGRLVIGDVGNNANQRRDLAVYLWPEPAPVPPRFRLRATPTTAAERLPFTYADQIAFPPRVPRFDAEGLAYFDDALHLYTKHRADGWTTLYRFAHLDPAQPPQTLVPLARFRSGGPVTDATVSVDELRLALLTYRGVWLFTRAAAGEDFWGASALVSFAPFTAGQCEGLTWLDPDTLLLSNEGRALHRLPLSAFPPATALVTEYLPVLPAAETAPAEPEPLPLAGPPSLILNEYNAVREGRWLEEDGAAAAAHARDLRLGRVEGNGGMWVEFVVTAPTATAAGRGVDLRGARLDWRQAGLSGTLVFSEAAGLSDLRRGVLLTIAAEKTLRDERGNTVVDGSRLAFHPDAGPDGWWLHLWSGDSRVVVSGHPLSDGKGTNDDFQVRLRDRDNRLLMDWTGEGVPPLSGVNSREVAHLSADPSAAVTPGHVGYGDSTTSTFGAPNRWREGKGKSAAEREQDFSALRTGSR